MKKKIIVANWKSYLTFEQEINWVKQNLNNLKLFELNTKIILCPSFLSLYEIHKLLKNFIINLGAQNCSSETIGNLTGEISAKSLKEIGCNYCIIGHSERRKFFSESNEIIKKKLILLSENSIIPILCIGENEEDYKKNKTKDILKKQLEVLNKFDLEKVIIAYEPIWSIGTGVIPDKEYLNQVFNFIIENIGNKTQILYGGSVNSNSINKLLDIEGISGFLIGKASTDFVEFNKILKVINQGQLV